MIDLESQSQAMRLEQFGNSRLRVMLAIASFIIHDPDGHECRLANAWT
jgi:hypothetical protein